MDTLKKQILEILISNINPDLVILFGSTVQGRTRKESDIDIAFLSEDVVNSYHLFTIAQELASKLNKDIDLIDLAKASTVFQAQIVSTGEVVYCSNEKRRIEFEMKTLKMYAKLNEERREIIDSIKESGTVYE